MSNNDSAGHRLDMGYRDRLLSPGSGLLRGARRSGLGHALAALMAGALVACGTTVTKHGHQFQESDLQQVQPGMSQDQVKTVLGSPATTAPIAGGNAFYYISSTQAQTAFFQATETDRQVVAVYFNGGGSVQRVANYGLKDGKVFDYISRTTPSANTADDGVLKALFRNLGQTTIFKE